MSFIEIYHQFLEGLQATGPIEFIAVISGIASVWFSKKENILVFPVGLINTTFYIYISIKGHLFGEATVNLYYTIVSIYGWILWARRNEQEEHVVKITSSSGREWGTHLLFFAFFYITIYWALTYLKNSFSAETIPWADAFASATAFTGMWLMAKKKVESWYWWIATDIAGIPLYFVKHFAFSSVYYFILLILAVMGLIEWRRKAKDYLAAEKAS